MISNPESTPQCYDLNWTKTKSCLSTVCRVSMTVWPVVSRPEKFNSTSKHWQFPWRKWTFMRWSDNRLLRRWFATRITETETNSDTDTLALCPEKWTQTSFPTSKHTDCIVNSALPYDCLFWKPNLEIHRKAINVTGKIPNDLTRHIVQTGYTNFWNMLKIPRMMHVSRPTHCFREFIGGSKYVMNQPIYLKTSATTLNAFLENRPVSSVDNTHSTYHSLSGASFVDECKQAHRCERVMNKPVTLIWKQLSSG